MTTTLAIKDKNNLPDTMPEIVNYILIGKKALIAHKAKIEVINKIETATTARQAAISEAQKTSEILLASEIKLGELTKQFPKKSGARSDLNQRHVTKKMRLKEMGISHSECTVAETLANNKVYVEELINQAREEGHVLTKNEVIKKIRERNKLIRKLDKTYSYKPDLETDQKVEKIRKDAHFLYCDARDHESGLDEQLKKDPFFRGYIETLTNYFYHKLGGVQ